MVGESDLGANVRTGQPQEGARPILPGPSQTSLGKARRRACHDPTRGQDGPPKLQVSGDLVASCEAGS